MKRDSDFKEKWGDFLWTKVQNVITSLTSLSKILGRCGLASNFDDLTALVYYGSSRFDCAVSFGKGIVR